MRRFVLFVFSIAILASCNNSGVGILYSISEEVGLSDSDSIPNELSVTGMGLAGDTYYVAAGSLFKRSAAAELTSPWETVALPESMGLCVRLEDFGGNIYGVFSDIAGTSSKLFTMAAGGTTWSEVAFFSDKRVVNIAADATILVVSTLNGTAYSSFESTNGTSFASMSLPGQYTAVTDVAVFAGKTWLISGKYLFNDESGSYVDKSTVDGPNTTTSYGGLYGSSSLGVLFVTSHEGYVYSLNGTVWSKALVSKDGETGIPLYDLDETSVLNEPVILIGSDSGYYEILFVGGYSATYSAIYPGSEAYSSSDSNYQKVPLRSSIVRFFLSDSTRHTVFACTSGEGLWINPIDDSDATGVVRKWDRQ